MTEMTWHTDKKIIIGLITAVLITLITSLGQWFYVIKTLDTDPPLINRIIALEYQVSEQGRVNQAILDELKEAKKDRKEASNERAAFRGEQSKRTTTVYDAAKHMKNRSIHK